MKKEDFENIIGNYNLGKLKDWKKVKRENYDQPCFIIKTTKGKYFLKVYYNKQDFYFTKKGFELLEFLNKKNYSAIKVFKTKSNENYLIFNKMPIAIFEFINQDDKYFLSTKEQYELGKMLGKLHVLTKDFPITRSLGYKHYYKMLVKSTHLKEKVSTRVKKVLDYVTNNFGKLKIPSNQPKSICHDEFTQEHVRFNKEKIIKVIDWDMVNRSFMFYDLGTTMTAAFYKGKGTLNFKHLSNIIKGYESQRKLTKWEKSHIFEAICFGTFKFWIWGLDEKMSKAHYRIMLEIETLMKLGKEEFNKRIGHIN